MSFKSWEMFNQGLKCTVWPFKHVEVALQIKLVFFETFGEILSLNVGLEKLESFQILQYNGYYIKMAICIMFGLTTILAAVTEIFIAMTNQSNGYNLFYLASF